MAVFGAMFFLLLSGWFVLWFFINWARFDNPKVSGWTLARDAGCVVLFFWCAVQLAGTLV